MYENVNNCKKHLNEMGFLSDTCKKNHIAFNIYQTPQNKYSLIRTRKKFKVKMEMHRNILF